MATDPNPNFSIVTRDLALINALGSSAEDLAIRSGADGVSADDRAALRNQAKTANEQAGALLVRVTVELFKDPPKDAVQQINDAISSTQGKLKKIKKAKKAIEFVGKLVGVAVSVASGDWKAISKSLDTLKGK